MQFFKNNWIYIAISFAVILLGGIGYITYTRLNSLTVTNVPTIPDATPVPTGEEASPNDVALTFQITPAVENSTSCLELVATPLDGTVPLSVSFTGVAQEMVSDLVAFTFDFGDDSSQTVEAAVTTPEKIVSQDITHTYTEPGDFTAILMIESASGIVTSESCALDITAGGLAREPIGGTNESTSVAQLIPTTAATVTPTRATTPTRTPTPGPTDDVAAPDVPVAGGLLPTALAAIGGLAIILLAFALL